jgi:hypothetical protein
LHDDFEIQTAAALIAMKELAAMGYDRSTVEAVVQNYFDGLYEGDADRIGAVFHPSADLRWVERGELKVLTVPDWRTCAGWKGASSRC